VFVSVQISRFEISDNGCTVQHKHSVNKKEGINFFRTSVRTKLSPR
jgi:hypothetical protein